MNKNITNSAINSIQRNRGMLLTLLVLTILTATVAGKRIIIIETFDKHTDVKLEARDQKEPPNSPAKTPLRKGVNIVAKKNYTITIRSGDKTTIVDKNPRMFSTNRIVVKLLDQRSVDTAALSSNSATCIFKNSGFFYTCKNNKLYRQNLANRSEQHVMPHLVLGDIAAPYEKGILSVISKSTSDDSEPQASLVYTDGSQTRVIEGLVQTDSQIIVNNTQPQKFLIHDRMQKKLYLYESLNDKSATEINYSRDVHTSSVDAIVSYAGNRVAINYSFQKKPNLSDNNEHPEYENMLTIYSVDDKKIQKDQNVNLSRITKSKNSSGDSWIISENIVLSHSLNGSLFVVDVQKNRKEVVKSTIGNVESVATNGEQIIYTQGNRLLQRSIASDTSYLLREKNHGLFGSPKIVGESIVFSGTSDEDRTQSSFFVLSSIKKRGTEPFDVIPYRPGDLPILSSWFHENTIYFSVNLSSLKINRDTDSVQYDDREFTLKKAMIRRRLVSDGIDLSKYKVSYKAGP